MNKDEDKVVIVKQTVDNQSLLICGMLCLVGIVAIYAIVKIKGKIQ